MKIWISKNSEVPVREQLVAQITLAIAAGDIGVGEKLPSTREISRRCDIHANTVSSAYQKLADQNLLEFRKGSGFYVAEAASARIEGSRRLDELIADLFSDAKGLGFEEEEVRRRLRRPRARAHAKKLVVIEPDSGLREIILHELRSEFAPAAVEAMEKYDASVSGGVIFAAMFDEKPKIDPILHDGDRVIYLKGRSVAMTMSGESRPSPDELVAVVSGWEGFLTFARIMLLAANIDPGSLIVRSTRDDGWQQAIKHSNLVICDSLAATSLDGRHGVRTFRIVSDESMRELAQALGR